ncbi:hypothetical protein IOLA_187 [uncultured bacterium]|nr:hypothetical protein IOLA_187 [uncultured bacterium]
MIVKNMNIKELQDNIDGIRIEINNGGIKTQIELDDSNDSKINIDNIIDKTKLINNKNIISNLNDNSKLKFIYYFVFMISILTIFVLLILFYFYKIKLTKKNNKNKIEAKFKFNYQNSY